MTEDTTVHSTSLEDTFQNDEVLILDARARLTPAEMVERKLVSMLKGISLPVSELAVTRSQRRSR